MTDREELVVLVRQVGRLTRKPYRSVHRLRKAHALLRYYATLHDLDEDWCDAVLLLFLDDWQ